MYAAVTGGWIEVICGGMFSGKSEELIRRIKRVQFANEQVAIFKPMLDNRYSDSKVVSHNGNAACAAAVGSAEEIERLIPQNTRVVAIDEAQFFDETIIAKASEWANRGYRVIIAGLDQDFRGQPFGPMPELLAIAEHVTKLQAVCVVCGSPASRTQRLVNGKPAAADEPTILVGASESYEARCRNHHEVPVVAADSALRRSGR